jgi:hypothetical protein
LLTGSKGNLELEEKTTSFATYSDGAGNVQIKEVTNIKYANEVMKKEELTHPDLLIFYNISAGYRLPITKSISMAIEPYVKLPASPFSIYKLQLVQTSLKVNFEF